MINYDKELYKKGESDLIDMIMKEHGYINLGEMRDQDYDDALEIVADEPWYYSDTMGPGIVYFSIIENFKGDNTEAFEVGNAWLKEYNEPEVG